MRMYRQNVVCATGITPLCCTLICWSCRHRALTACAILCCAAALSMRCTAEYGARLQSQGCIIHLTALPSTSQQHLPPVLAFCLLMFLSFDLLLLLILGLVLCHLLPVVLIVHCAMTMVKRASRRGM